VGSLGFEPRIANAPGWYTKPFQPYLAPVYPTATEADMVAIRRPHSTIRYEDQIINTLLQLKNNGKSQNTLRSVSYGLRQLTTNTDLHNPEAVKTYIANLKLRNNTKQRLVNSYDYYCRTNNIQWIRPKYYKWDRIIPIIPTKENIYKIISGASTKYATIFTILEQTGLEGQELATMQRKYIDAEQGIISCEGCKNHNGRQVKLKTATAELLRQYLHKYTAEKPFPTSRSMSEMWQRARKHVAQKLNQPELLKIPLRNLRHHHACEYYRQTNNILMVMQRLGHKKIETTMLYTQLIALEEDGQYDVQGAYTKDQAKKLIEAGFEYVNTIEGTALYRKRK
jgi:integrase